VGGDIHFAKDVAQTVFIDLAREGRGLSSQVMLGGWLHRRTCHVAAALLRGERRRQIREREAMDMNAQPDHTQANLARVAPILDEAINQLNAKDRAAIILRFFEQRDFRSVGEAMKCSEDAARMRVSRALDKLHSHLSRRGVTLAVGALATGLAAEATTAAPAGLAASVAGTALSVCRAATGVNTILFHLMKLTKTQIVAACVVFAAVPLAWQHFTQRAYLRQQAAIEAQIAEFTRRASALEAETTKVWRAAEQARANAANAQLQLDRIGAQLANTAPRARYRWDDNSPYARAPKEALSHQRRFAIATDRGQLSDGIKKLLQMNEEEASQTQDAVNRLLSTYESLEASVIKRAQPTKEELKLHVANEVRALDVPYIGSSQMTQLRQEFFGQVTTILGGDRADVFTNSLSPWMPLRDDSGESGSPEAIYCSDLRVVFYQPKPGDKIISASFSAHGPQGFYRSGQFGPDEIPPLYAPYVHDWVAAIQNPPP
jgi:RNA polymerase sigma factor (sigma-70 family)